MTRDNSCGKLEYRSRAKARAAARRSGETVREYYCDRCGVWHLKHVGGTAVRRSGVFRPCHRGQLAEGEARARADRLTGHYHIPSRAFECQYCHNWHVDSNLVLAALKRVAGNA